MPAQSEIFRSPDGKKLAFRAYEGTWNLYVINADGTGLKQVIHGAGENSYVNQVAWSPDALLGSASAPKRGFSHDMSTKVSRECGLGE